ncbi:hypothetical protein GA0115233_101264 [Streptomyces sp. DI166]|nr:hypothetical protein GA0115233_101264 [Streptomyces sp. DI166]
MPTTSNHPSNQPPNHPTNPPPNHPTNHPTYQSLFHTPEFTPLFLTSASHTAAQTIAGLALATHVYRATNSPLLSAISMFGPSLAQMLGATLFLSGADRLPPRATLTYVSLAFATATAVLAAPGLPIWSVFVVLLAQGLIASLAGGVRWGLLNEILAKDGYLLGRSVFNMMSGITQITGYALGGALLALLTPRTCLLLAAFLYALAATGVRLGLTPAPHAPPATRRSPRPGAPTPSCGPPAPAARSTSPSGSPTAWWSAANRSTSPTPPTTRAPSSPAPPSAC